MSGLPFPVLSAEAAASLILVIEHGVAESSARIHG